jgi:hypothetical protein
MPRSSYGGKLLGKKARSEMGDVVSARVTCGELLDDLLEYAGSNIKASTDTFGNW